MSKKVREVEVVDEDLLKILLDSISVLSNRLSNLEVAVAAIQSGLGVYHDKP